MNRYNLDKPRKQIDFNPPLSVRDRVKYKAIDVKGQSEGKFDAMIRGNLAVKRGLILYIEGEACIVKWDRSMSGRPLSLEQLERE